MPMRSLIVMQAGIDASPLFGRPNSNPSSRRGTRSVRRQGWANVPDASRCVVRLHHEKQELGGCFLQPHIEASEQFWTLMEAVC